ncbi:maleylpyruvate isomerase family mycothiol-dependent enzyme [Gordonia sp. CPCC 206044]|uniref:maleylpyruvate isomerase family mycothiol-dependent enzyme n=1 Tax=Gordonia sp. CPCC 206044 TaxID=3140793 RepID=UPI003AF3CCBE
MTTHSDISHNHDLDLVTRFRHLADGFGAVLEDADGTGTWAAASPCEGWTARDVVGHVIDTQRDFLTGHGVSLGEQPSLDDPVAAWRSHSAAVCAQLADPAVGDMPFDGYFGPTTVGETLMRFYGFDMVAHRWDVSVAAGRELRFTDDELTMMESAADGFGPALYGDGVCKAGVEVSADADRQTRLLARLGRAT